MNDIRHILNNLEKINEDKNIRPLLMEGGSMPNAGAIHISEIEPTLKKLEKYLNIDLRNNTLGSVGKKEYSGDIDIALDIKPEDIPAFMEKLKSIPEIKDISKSSVIMTTVEIENYDPNKKPENKKRTGIVQIDFMPGDIDWLKTFYHAPYEKDSKYSGVFRNILISTIAAFLDKKESSQKLPDGRPLQTERYMFSPSDGLVRIIRTPEPNKKNDGYTKKNINKIIDGPYKNINDIARVLKFDSPKDLYSYETIRKAMDKHYSTDLVKQILDSFSQNSIVQSMGVPSDIQLNEGAVTTDWFRVILSVIG